MSAPGSKNDKYIACASMVPDCQFDRDRGDRGRAHEEGRARTPRTTMAITEVTPELAAKVKAAIKNR